jgi:NAD(P)H-hydrate epimerase
MFRSSDHEGGSPDPAQGSGKTPHDLPGFSSGYGESAMAVPALPDRPTDGHKGTFGTVVVVGGCFTMPGAPALCAASALRSGAGLVKIAAERGVLPTALTIEPCATGIVMHNSVGDRLSALRAAGEKAVWAIGPGWGGEERVDWLRSMLIKPGKKVLDADGLNALARSNRPAAPQTQPEDLVLTPHPGEYRRLAQAVGIAGIDNLLVQDRSQAALQLSEKHHGCVVVLKGRHTVVALAPDRVYVNLTGSVALATPGSGDVLTGVIAALLAQGMGGYDAARLGVYLHGRAGERWHRKHGPTGLTARLLLRQLAPVFQEHRDRDIPF